MTPLRAGRRKTDFVIERISPEEFYTKFQTLCTTVASIDEKLDKHVVTSDAENKRIEDESKARDAAIKKDIGWVKGIGAFIITILAAIFGITK